MVLYPAGVTWPVTRTTRQILTPGSANPPVCSAGRMRHHTGEHRRQGDVCQASNRRASTNGLWGLGGAQAPGERAVVP